MPTQKTTIERFLEEHKALEPLQVVHKFYGKYYDENTISSLQDYMDYHEYRIFQCETFAKDDFEAGVHTSQEELFNQYNDTWIDPSFLAHILVLCALRIDYQDILTEEDTDSLWSAVYSECRFSGDLEFFINTLYSLFSLYGYIIED